MINRYLKTSTLLFALLLLALQGSYFTSFASAKFLESEFNALKDLYLSTKGQYWLWHKPYSNLTGYPWNFTDPSTNPCLSNWQGITCNSVCSEITSCYVVKLTLRNHFLNGNLPETIGNLSKLEILQLGSNQIDGSLPSSLGSIEPLQELDLSRNSIEGQIPNSFKGLKVLRDFSLAFNELSGSIGNILSLTTLVNILAAENHFSGTIPESISNLKRMVYFDFAANDLSGEIPPGIGDLSLLNSIQLISNKLSGSIPPQIGNLKQIKVLAISSNKLTGTIPPEIGNLTSLRELFLMDNHLTGAIPEEIGQLSKLNGMYMFVNHLSGSLPASLGNITTLTDMDLVDNFFTGTIPPQIGQLTVLRGLYLYRNLITGTIPQTFFDMKILREIDIHKNFISGSIPDNFGQLTSLLLVLLHNNMLSGTIPSSLLSSSMKTLEALEINDNKLVGSIPSSLTCPKLIYFIADVNKLDHSIPESLCSLQTLIYLNVSTNSLSGSLPSCIGDLYRLQQLDISNNQITGTIPKSSVNFTDLRMMYLQSNRLSGSFDFNPKTNDSAFLYLSNVDISSNRFTGTLPARIFTLPRLETYAATENCLQGSLPEEICSASKLRSLVLNGLSSAPTCQDRLLARFPSYILRFHITGGIPTCIFDLRALTTLQLSGNGITGTISDEVVIGNKMTELVLSHNHLSGSIPLAIQHRNWTVLDLSFNSFYGVISNNFGKTQSEVKLNVNRLSGTIPEVLHGVTDIAILDGNIFECSAGRQTLPADDPKKDTYQCDSESFDISASVWLSFACLFTILILVALVSVGRKHKRRDQILQAVGCLPAVRVLRRQLRWGWHCLRLTDELMLVTGKTTDTGVSSRPYLESTHHVRLLGFLLLDLRTFILKFSIVILLILLPLYGLFTEYYNSYKYEYAWTLSAAFLSSEIAGLALMIVLAGFSTAYFFSLKRNIFHVHTKPLLTLRNLHAATKQSLSIMCGGQISQIEFFDSFLWVLLLLVNCVVVGAVNIYFLYVTSRSTAAVTTFAEMLLGLFKLLWNNCVMFYDVHRVVQLRFSNKSKLSVIEKSPDLSAGQQSSDSMNQINNIESGVTATTTANVLINAVCTEIGTNTDSVEGAVLDQCPAPPVDDVAKFNANKESPPSSQSKTDKDTRSHSSRDSSTGTEESSDVPSIGSSLAANNRIAAETPASHSAKKLLGVTVQVFIVFLNLIIIPCFAISVFQTTCFYNVFREPPIVEVSYQFTECLRTNVLGTCQTTTEAYHFSSFSPPYSYSFQCSSSLIKSYAATFVYMFITNGFLRPPALLWLMWLLRVYPKEKYSLMRYISWYLPTLLQPLSSDDPSSDEAATYNRHRKLFHSSRYIVGIISSLAVLVTFGFVFPLLAVTISVGLLIETYFTYFLIGRVLLHAKTENLSTSAQSASAQLSTPKNVIVATSDTPDPNAKLEEGNDTKSTAISDTCTRAHAVDVSNTAGTSGHVNGDALSTIPRQDVSDGKLSELSPLVMRLNNDCKGLVDYLQEAVAWQLLFFACLFYSFFVFDTIGSDAGFQTAGAYMLAMMCWPVLVWIIHRIAMAVNDDPSRQYKVHYYLNQVLWCISLGIVDRRRNYWGNSDVNSQTRPHEKENSAPHSLNGRSTSASFSSDHTPSMYGRPVSVTRGMVSMIDFKQHSEEA